MSHEDQSLMSAPYPVRSDPQKRRGARGGVPRGPRRRPDGLVTLRAAVSLTFPAVRWEGVAKIQCNEPRHFQVMRAHKLITHVISHFEAGTPVKK